MVSLKRGIVTKVILSGTTRAAGSEDVSVVSVEISFFTSVAGSSLLSVVLSPLKSEEKSSPYSPIMANKESTGAVCPSCKPMCKRVPSLKDSNSIVALSVSISARISPSSILSPTFFSHFATTP
jgi:hypothetical protein